MIGYFLRGVAKDHILVFRSEDAEEILQVIKRLGASRNKQMRALAQQLEIDWNESQYNKERKKN